MQKCIGILDFKDGRGRKKKIRNLRKNSIFRQTVVLCSNSNAAPLFAYCLVCLDYVK